MSDYTPTDLIVRMRYANGRDDPAKEWAAFDRWLAKHDAEVRADEREQTAQRADKYGEEHTEIRVAFRNFAWLLRGMPGLAAAARGEDWLCEHVGCTMQGRHKHVGGVEAARGEGDA